ncbi:MAG: hypothetical protein ACPGUU_07825 [Flavobacteriaceae bacterium]
MNKTFKILFVFSLIFSFSACNSYKKTKYGYKIKGKNKIIFNGIDKSLKENSSLSGFIYLKDDKVFPDYAKIIIGETILITDKNGFFEVNVKPGVYDIIAKCLGHNDEIIKGFKLEKNNKVIILFELGTEAIY